MDTVQFFAMGVEVGNTKEVADEILSGLRQLSDDSRLAEHMVMYYDMLAEWESPNKQESLTKLINALRDAMTADLGLETVERILMIIGFTYLAFPNGTGKDIANRILSIVKDGSGSFSAADLIEKLSLIIDSA